MFVARASFVLTRIVACLRIEQHEQRRRRNAMIDLNLIRSQVIRFLCVCKLSRAIQVEHIDQELASTCLMLAVFNCSGLNSLATCNFVTLSHAQVNTWKRKVVAVGRHWIHAPAKFNGPRARTKLERGGAPKLAVKWPTKKRKKKKSRSYAGGNQSLLLSLLVFFFLNTHTFNSPERTEHSTFSYSHCFFL